MGGERYTFKSRVGAKLSKLDRFLACSNFLTAFPSLVGTAHPRELSDHNPVTLSSRATDYGPRPFKLFNSWLLKEGFDCTVKDAWERFVRCGNPDAYLAAKLKNLKDEIKKWKSKNDNIESLEVEKIKANISQLEKLTESRSLTDAELGSRNEGLRKILELEKLAVLDLKQRERVKWTVEGDENTKFFHGYINNKHMRNTIHGLLVNGK